MCPDRNVVPDNWEFLSRSAPNLYLRGLSPSGTYSRDSCHPQSLLRAGVLSFSKISLQRLRLSNLLVSRGPFPCGHLPGFVSCTALRVCYALRSGPLGAWLAGPQCQGLPGFRVLFSVQTPDTQPHPCSGKGAAGPPTTPFVSSPERLLVGPPSGHRG